jgi:hypothetical protein
MTGVAPLDYVHLKPEMKKNFITGCLKWLILEGPTLSIHALFFLLPDSRDNELAVGYVKRIAKRQVIGSMLYLFHSLLSLYVHVMWHKIECCKQSLHP